MTNTDELFDKFKQWAYGPNTEPTPQDTQSVKDALEAGMFSAYRAGYRQALLDCDAAQRVVEALKSRE